MLTSHAPPRPERLPKSLPSKLFRGSCTRGPTVEALEGLVEQQHARVTVRAYGWHRHARRR